MSPRIRGFAKQWPQLGQGVYLDPTATVIGDVVLGDEVSVWPMAVIRGDVNSIRIGARTNIQDGSVLHVTHAGPLAPQGFALSIGEQVTVGHQVILHGCTVRDRCLIGMGTKVLDGALIEAEVLVGAGSLVPPGKVLESGFLWVGSPVRKVRPLSQEERAFFEYSAEHYVQLKNQYLQAEA